MPILSIIIPVYNVEKYIVKCIKSIINQSFTEWEAILIDDGSTDKSGEICDQYSSIDDRIHVIHKENGGVSSARNYGLDIAKGKYIGFIDPDDYIDEDMFYKLILSLEKNNCQIGICNFYDINQSEIINGNKNLNKDNMSEHICFNKIDIVSKLFDTPRTIYSSVCNKIFIKDIIGKLRFDENIRVCEDNLFLYNYLLKIEKAIWINEYLYFRILRDDSATNGDPKKLVPCLDVRKKIWLLTIEKVPVLIDIVQADYLDDCLRILNLLKHDRRTYGKLISKNIRECIAYNFIDFINNRKISWKLKIIYMIISISIY